MPASSRGGTAVIASHHPTALSVSTCNGNQDNVCAFVLLALPRSPPISTYRAIFLTAVHASSNKRVSSLSMVQLTMSASFRFQVMSILFLISVASTSEFSISRVVPISSLSKNPGPISRQGEQAQVDFIPLCTDSSHANTAVTFFTQCKPCHDFLIAYDIAVEAGLEEFLPDSECSPECCAKYSLNNFDTAHFISCYKGCCSRIVSLQTSGLETPEQVQYIIETQVVVVNEVSVSLFSTCTHRTVEQISKIF